MGEMASMGQVQAHQSVTGLHDSGVSVEVCGGTRQGLDVDSPDLGVQVERLQGSLLAQRLGLINELVTTVVSGARVALRVLVLHDGAQGVHDGLRGEVFRRDQGDGADLPVGFLLDDVCDLGIGRVQGLLSHLGIGRRLGGVGSKQASVERPGKSSESLHLGVETCVVGSESGYTGRWIFRKLSLAKVNLGVGMGQRVGVGDTTETGRVD